jgi:hypothetical protein
MKSTHRFLSAVMAGTTAITLSSGSPYERRTVVTSAASSSGISSVSFSSLARSEAKCSASVRAAKYPPRPIAIAPAATSASPAVMMIPVASTAPDSPAARANGTVRPSDMPITMSRIVSEEVKCFST